MEKCWPERGLLSNQFGFKLIEPSEEEKLGSKNPFWAPYCKCCGEQFWWPNAHMKNVKDHFGSVAHLKKQHAINNQMNVGPQSISGFALLSDEQQMTRLKLCYFVMQHPTISLNAGAELASLGRKMYTHTHTHTHTHTRARTHARTHAHTHTGILTR